MLGKVLIHILIVVMVLWYWSNTDVVQKDGLFYVYFLSSQLGLFLAYEKISKLRRELDGYVKHQSH